MFCRQCGKELPDGVKFCPACGAEVNPAQEAPKPEPMQPVYEAPKEEKKEGEWNILAIVSFSIAILGVLGYTVGGVSFHFVTLVLSIIALSQIKKSPTMQGKGLAVAATVISSISIVAFIIGLIVSIILFVVKGVFIFGIFKEIFSSSVLLPTLFF